MLIYSKLLYMEKMPAGLGSLDKEEGKGCHLFIKQKVESSSPLFCLTNPAWRRFSKKGGNPVATTNRLNFCFLMFLMQLNYQIQPRNRSQPRWEK
jgi:hypothetical protein